MKCVEQALTTISSEYIVSVIRNIAFCSDALQRHTSLEDQEEE